MQNIKEINILITCVASQIMPKVIRLIREFNEAKIKIVGVDSQTKANSIGAHFSDIFYKVPNGHEDDYLAVISEIVSRENIHIIFPGSDEEVIKLSKAKTQLKDKYNCEVVCSDYSSTILSSNKFKMLTELESRNIHTGRFNQINDIGSISDFARQINFPKNNFIIKPKVGRGSKGVKLITDTINKKERFFSKNNFYITLNEALAFFSEYPEEMKDYFMMEYFPGEKFSTDLLIQNGKIVHSVTRSNGIHPKINPPTQVADIVFNKEISNYVSKVFKIAKFDSFLQVETGYDKDGKLGFIESNARLDATLPITLGVGINYYHEFIRYLVYGKEFKDKELDQSSNRFFRYWEDTFINIKNG